MTVKQTSGEKERALKLELAQRLMARRRLLPFTKRMNPKYTAGWVHKDICARLERFSDDVIAGTSPRLMLLMPPRHGKSELASRNFPAWHLGRRPDHEYIGCSYNLSLAMTFSRKIKQIFDDPSYQTVFEARLDPNNQSTEEWGIANNSGGYVAAGIGGGITGKGAHILGIDDPLKSAEDADSPDIREKLWDWYGSTAYTRLAPGGGVLIIQTCWHDDDLAGRLQAAMAADPEADQFEIVKYPAIAEMHEFLDHVTGDIIRIDPPDFNEPDRATAVLRLTGLAASLTSDPEKLELLRLKGDPLHAERYDIRKLLQIKKTLTSRFWTALYQQNPVPDDGEFFTADQFRRMPLPEKEKCNVSIAWDFAISTKQQNDYTVGSAGLTDYDDVLHVGEVVRFKSGDAHFIVEAMINLARRWYVPGMVVGVEDGQIWRSIESVLTKRMRELRFYFSIELLKPLTDKRARASTLQARMQQGMVSFNSVGDWFDGARAEMLRFPNGVHDDIVDSLAWMARVAVDRPIPKRPRSKPLKSWRDQLKGVGGTRSHMTA